MNKFLCGEFYNEITSDLYNNISKTEDRFSILFSEYLNFAYDDNRESLITQWNLYMNNVNEFEKNYDKYVFEMNPLELKDMLMSITSDSLPIQSNVYSLVNQYINWCIGYKQMCSINNLSTINKDEVIRVNKKAISKSLFGLKTFWEIINEMIIKTDNQTVSSLVFARYGIIGKDLEYQFNLKLEHINREDKIVSIYNNNSELVTILSIDNDFINFCDNLNEEEGYFGDNLIKVKNERFEVTDNMMYARIIKACNSINYKTIRLNNMLKCRILDVAFNIRKERLLSKKDIRDIVHLYEPNSSAGRYANMAKLYEELTGEQLLHGRNPKTIEDPNGVEFVINIKRDLGFI